MGSRLKLVAEYRVARFICTQDSSFGLVVLPQQRVHSLRSTSPTSPPSQAQTKIAQSEEATYEVAHLNEAICEHAINESMPAEVPSTLRVNPEGPAEALGQSRSST